MNRLIIRYANRETTPSRYFLGGWTRTDPIITDDYWTIRGDEDALRRHVQAALADNNLNDYRLYSTAAVQS